MPAHWTDLPAVQQRLKSSESSHSQPAWLLHLCTIVEALLRRIEAAKSVTSSTQTIKENEHRAAVELVRSADELQRHTRVERTG